jgi:hypothetical protein
MAAIKIVLTTFSPILATTIDGYYVKIVLNTKYSIHTLETKF